MYVRYSFSSSFTISSPSGIGHIFPHQLQGQLDSFQGQWDRLQDDFRAKHQELVQKTGKHSQALAILEDKNGALEAKEQQLVVLQEQLGADAKKLQDTLASCALVQKDLEVGCAVMLVVAVVVVVVAYIARSRPPLPWR